MSVYINPQTQQLERLASGALRSVSGAEAVQQSMYIRLTTRRGSVIWDPSFGSRLHEIVTKRADTVQRVEAYVREALEPMVLAGELLELQVQAQASGRNRIDYLVSAVDAGRRPVTFQNWVQLQ